VTLAENHKHRENLVSTVKSKLRDIDDEVWDSINFYYKEIRCDFYHQSAAKTITDTALLDYKDTVEFVLNKAFKAQIGQIVSGRLANVIPSELQETIAQDTVSSISVTRVKGKVAKVILAVAATEPGGADQVNEFFKKEGEPLRIKKTEFTGLVARNGSTKKYFWFDRQRRKWSLSNLGRFKLNHIQSEASNVG